MNAKRVVEDAISNGDVGASKWWLERRASDESSKILPLEPKEVKPPSPFASMTDDELIRFGREMNYITEAEL